MGFGNGNVKINILASRIGFCVCLHYGACGTGNYHWGPESDLSSRR